MSKVTFSIFVIQTKRIFIYNKPIILSYETGKIKHRKEKEALNFILGNRKNET